MPTLGRPAPLPPTGANVPIELLRIRHAIPSMLHARLVGDGDDIPLCVEKLNATCDPSAPQLACCAFEYTIAPYPSPMGASSA